MSDEDTQQNKSSGNMFPLILLSLIFFVVRMSKQIVRRQYAGNMFHSNTQRNVKEPLLAGSLPVSIAWRRDVFTNGGAGWCSISSSLATFTRTALMVGTSYSDPSSSTYSLVDAAKSPNGPLGVLYNGGYAYTSNSGSTWTFTSGSGIR